MITNILESIGDCALLALGMRESLRSPFAFKELARQVVEIGSRSVPLIVACGERAGMLLSQQIDALKSMAVDCFKYLVVTRVAACMAALVLVPAK